MLTTDKAAALAAYLDIPLEDVQETLYGDFEADGEEWLILTEREADERWDEALESYIDECIIPELPEYLASYFDVEAWKRDARFDGRGHCLATYDGEEHELFAGDEYFLAYRTN
jgi:hypothetical protein